MRRGFRVFEAVHTVPLVVDHHPASDTLVENHPVLVEYAVRWKWLCCGCSAFFAM
jgi:hypothetical protein